MRFEIPIVKTKEEKDRFLEMMRKNDLAKKKRILNKKNKKMEENNTNIWIVLNEHTLNTMKGKHGRTAKFLTEAEANEKAASKLELWVCINVNFNHRWINHKI